LGHTSRASRGGAESKPPRPLHSPPLQAPLPRAASCPLESKDWPGERPRPGGDRPPLPQSTLRGPSSQPAAPTSEKQVCAKWCAASLWAEGAVLPPPGSPARGGAGPSGWRGPARAERARAEPRRAAQLAGRTGARAGRCGREEGALGRAALALASRRLRTARTRSASCPRSRLLSDLRPRSLSLFLSPSFLLPRYPLPRPRASGSAPGSLGSAPLSRRPGPASRSRSLPARRRLIVGGGQITPPGGGAGGQRRGRGLSRSPAPPARLPSALTAALPPCSAAAAHGARRPGPWPPRAAAALPAALRVLFLYR
jgi:hypothetical protein